MHLHQDFTAPFPIYDIGYTGVSSCVVDLLVKFCVSKLLPQFSRHLNKTCYTWPLSRIDLHAINSEVRPKGSRVMPLFWNSYISIYSISFDKAGIGGMLFPIKCSSSFLSHYYRNKYWSAICMNIYILCILLTNVIFRER